MSAPPYMKLYVADYLADTAHLKTREHGAYLLLLMALWRAGGKLPADDKTLAAKALCTASEWLSLKPIILPFFRVSRGKITQKRLGAELAKYENKICKLKEAGKRGSLVTNEKHGHSSAANAQKNLGKCRHNQNQNVGIEGSYKPSTYIPRERADEQPDGSSASRADVVDLEALRQKIASGAFD